MENTLNRAGRKKGSPNKAKGKFDTPKIKSKRKEIRCTAEFLTWLRIAAEKEKVSEADLIHHAFRYYLTGSAWWLQGEQFKSMQNDL